METDINQYLELFIEESKEHLQNLNHQLLAIEKDPQDTIVLNDIFRVAHTLKGMAGTMGFSKMTELTHDMENVLQEVRNRKIKINTVIIDILFQCLDALEEYLNHIIYNGNEGAKEYKHIIHALNTIITDISTVESLEQIKQQSAILDDASLNEDNNLVIDEFAQNIINKALDMGMSAYHIKVKLSAGCVLKSARAFMVFKTLEDSCEIIKSNPSVEDIEDENFDFEFDVIVVTKETKEKLEKDLNSIAEIEEIVLRCLKAKTIPERSVKEDEKKQLLYKHERTNDVTDIQDDIHSDRQVLKSKTGKTVRVDIERLDNLMNLVSELIIIKTRLEDIEGADHNSLYGEAVEYLERITTSMHDAVMKVRMVPVEMVFNRFPRMIRDLSKELHKKITLNMYGSETEVDRTVIDEIGDPLIHLLRNSADHGIETPEVRIARNKPEHGTINLKAYHDGNNVVIEVQDDGNGIDVEKVKQKIISKGLVDKDIADSLSQKEIIDFLFKPSFSTAMEVTDVSGRGVGLDVVKTKIEALGGIIEVETEREKGSKFIIRLPLTLAIIQALMVMLGNEKYAIPLNSIKEIINIDIEDIKLVQKKEVILLRNTVIPIIRLNNILDIPEIKEQEKKQLTIVIIKKGDKLSGFVVDKLLGQQEIVIKPVGKHLSGIRNIAGATILGDGQVALILDVNALAL